METMKQKTEAFLDAGDPEGPSPEDLDAIVARTAFETFNTIAEDASNRRVVVTKHYAYFRSVIYNLVLASYQAGIEDTCAGGVEGYHAGYTEAYVELKDMAASAYDAGKQAGYDKGIKDGRVKGYTDALKPMHVAEAEAWKSGYSCGHASAVSRIRMFVDTVKPDDK